VIISDAVNTFPPRFFPKGKNLDGDFDYISLGSNMSITQKSIASEAKVSQALVSLILSQNANPVDADSKRRVRVTEETRQRVLEVAARLGYQGRGNSRSSEFKKDQSLSLLRLAPGILEGDSSPESRRNEEIWQQTLQNALIEAASKMGFTLNVRIFQDSHEAEHWLECSRMDGLLFGSPFATIPAKLHGKTPLVSLCGKSLLFCDSVAVDSEEIAALALGHLQALGHRKVALLGSHLLPKIATLRPSIFKECASALGMSAIEAFEDCQGAKDFIGKFLAPENATNRPSALIVEESLAIQIRQEALRLGMNLPRDLSLIGMSCRAFHDLSEPALSTVDFCPDDLARAALRLIGDRFQKAPEAFWKVSVSPKLAVRQSVAELHSTTARHLRNIE
jgi:LacI family transcriptional regulator